MRFLRLLRDEVFLAWGLTAVSAFWLGVMFYALVVAPGRAACPMFQPDRYAPCPSASVSPR